MMQNSEYRLRKCPFCGGQARIIKAWDGMYHAECRNCTCQTAVYDTQLAAVRRWNQRADKSAKWIRCDERLPSNDFPCIVSCRTWNMMENAWGNSTIMILSYLPKEERWNSYGMVDVQAWMPFPDSPEP